VDDGAGSGRPVLFQSRPNPFRDATAISYMLPRRARATLQLFDVQGRLVRTLVDGTAPAGLHTVTWDRRANDGQRAASGVYFYRLRTPGQETSRKLVLIR
jgi:hypothetical protein